MYKAGTVTEARQLHGKVPEEIYREVLRIVTILDETYGAKRDVDNSDGGFVLVVENVQDVADISRLYVDIGSNRHEAVSLVKCKKELYIDAFFLCNNEFGINVLMPTSIAPGVLLDDINNSKRR